MALRGVDALLDELEKAKSGLKNVDKTIAKLTGRDPTEPSPRGRPRPSPRGPDDGRGRGRIFASARRSIGEDDMGPPAKRRIVGGAFSRLGPRVVVSRVEPRYGRDSGDEDQFAEKPAVQSSVVASNAVVRSREDVSESLSKDKESKGRNRRMFGALLGTLQRFKDEEKTKEEKEKMRKVVEEKLEKKARTEVTEARKERRRLFEERQKKEQKIKSLEQKMELVKIHEQWATQTHILGNFIRTKSKPHLYYIPKQHVTTTKDRLKQTKELLEKVIKDRRAALEEEIAELTREEDDEEPTVEETHNTSLHSDNGDKSTLEQPEDMDIGGEGGGNAEREMEGEEPDTLVDNKENMEVERAEKEPEGELGVDSSEALKTTEEGVAENGVKDAGEPGEEEVANKVVEKVVDSNEGDDKQAEVAEISDRTAEVNTDSPSKTKSHHSHSKDSDSHHSSRRESSSRSRRDSKGHRDRSGERSKKSRHGSGESGSHRRTSREGPKVEKEEGDKRVIVSEEAVDGRTVESKSDDTRLVETADMDQE